MRHGPWFYADRLPLTSFTYAGFYADRLPLTSFTYAGKRADDIHVSIALANSGDMQIELIQQRSDHPSMYRDFLAENPRGGLQHWSMLAAEL